MKRTYIPTEAEIRLGRIRGTRQEYKLLPNSLLLNFVLADYEKKITKTDIDFSNEEKWAESDLVGLTSEEEAIV